jgi:hypothetical protein
MARSAEVLSHWDLLIDDYNTSALDFYAAVEKAVGLRKVPDTKLSRVDWKEGGVLSAKREYLRVAKGRLTFDICAAPYGTSYFFSWWFALQAPENVLLLTIVALLGVPLLFFALLQVAGFMLGAMLFFLLLVASPFILGSLLGAGLSELEETIVAMPFFGPYYRRVMKPVTYYAEDTRLMFQESVHRAVMEIISEARSARGLRALSDDESRPKMRDLFR